MESKESVRRSYYLKDLHSRGWVTGEGTKRYVVGVVGRFDRRAQLERRSLDEYQTRRLGTFAAPQPWAQVWIIAPFDAYSDLTFWKTARRLPLIGQAQRPC